MQPDQCEVTVSSLWSQTFTEWTQKLPVQQAQLHSCVCVVQEPAAVPALAGAAGGGDALQEGVAPAAGRGERRQPGLSLQAQHAQDGVRHEL